MAKSKVGLKPTSARSGIASGSDPDSWRFELAQREMRESLEVHANLAKVCINDVLRISEAIAGALKKGRKVAFFGNGGSAADAQHLAAELVGKFLIDRPALRALAFTTNSSVLTAIGNDFRFEEIFSRQVAAHIDDGDVVVAISTSGRSRNVISGVQEARKRGALSVALTGSSGHELSDLCDYRVMVPSTNTQRIQECHILIGHTICALVEASLTR